MKSIVRQYLFPVLLATATILASFLIFLLSFSSITKEIINAKAIVLTTPAQYQAIESGGQEKIDESRVSSDKGVFAIGKNAMVYGTGVDGLRIRTDAGLNSIVLFLIQETSQVQIQEGPILKDGMIWWKVQTKQGPGWTVQNYLEIIE